MEEPNQQEHIRCCSTPNVFALHQLFRSLEVVSIQSLPSSGIPRVLQAFILFFFLELWHSKSLPFLLCWGLGEIY
jgi:hypothetical protein